MTIPIPYLDLKAQYRTIADEVNEAALRVLASGHYVLGPEVAGFERAFADWTGSGHAVTVNSGTTALQLALLACGIGPGDEVITVPMTFVATVAAIQYTGARPVLVDVDPVTWTLDPAQVEAAITPRTRALLPVHLHGLPADLGALGAIARRHGLRLIEDAAQAHGAAWQGRPAGSVGDLGCFSFYPGKNLGAAGEGGAVVTDDPALAERLRLLRDWGQSRKYCHALPGFNARMDALQAAVLAVKLRHLDGWTTARRRHAAAYDAALAPLLESGAVLGRPQPPADRRHVYHVYAVTLPDRDAAQQALNAAGIATGIHYPVPVHLQPAYASSAMAPVIFRSPSSWRAASCRCRSTPNCPTMRWRGWRRGWRNETSLRRPRGVAPEPHWGLEAPDPDSVGPAAAR